MTSTVFILLALFGIKHFIADFVLQFPYMTREKGIYLAEGGIHHAWVHSVLTFVILLFFCHSVHDMVTLSAIDFLLHYHIDWAKQKLNKTNTPQDRVFWLWLGLDQAMHYLTYVGIIAYVTIG
jgi:hypothetical protein